jgi:preprotein translocase subunit SecA
MAGRGTDIVLGGNLNAELAAAGGEPEREALRRAWQVRHDQVLKAGGLHIIGTERHESRRIDNQLRGRSGRQGDPGSSRFYLSMEDNLIRIFGDPERTKRLLMMVGMRPGEVIESRMLTRQIQRAQQKVEAHNFDIRKHLLLFDDVANDQRKLIYEQRTGIMATADLSGAVREMTDTVTARLLAQTVPAAAPAEAWDIPALNAALAHELNLNVDVGEWLKEEPPLGEAALRERVVQAVQAAHEERTALIGAPLMREAEKVVMLGMLDRRWREHLAMLAYLQQSIHLRGYAQLDYRYEFKREAFQLFSSMLDQVRRDTIAGICRLQVSLPVDLTGQEPESAAPGA